MTISLNGRLDEQVTTYVAAAGLLLTSTLGDTDYVSMKGFRRCQIIISIADGTTVTADEAYIRRSIMEPRAQVAQGFNPVMPQIRLSATELDALVAYIRSLH